MLGHLGGVTLTGNDIDSIFVILN